jgi:hypothetical protein
MPARPTWNGTTNASYKEKFMKAKEALEKDDLFITTAMAVMYGTYGAEFLEWDPLTINLNIIDDFKITPTQELKDKIQAGVTIITTDMFYRSLETFFVISNLSSNEGYSTEMLIPPELDEVAWACVEAKLLDSEYESMEFSGDISRYVGFLLDREGIFTPPSILRYADYPESTFLDGVPEDNILYKEITEAQEEKRSEFVEALRLRTLALFSQLRSLEMDGKNDEFIEKALPRLQQGL